MQHVRRTCITSFYVFKTDIKLSTDLCTCGFRLGWTLSKCLNSSYIHHPASQVVALVLQPQSKYMTETPTERSCPNRALAVPASKANCIFVFPCLQVQKCLLASGQKISGNRIRKHSARFISIVYEAFTCRIIGQKVQRVPVLPKVGWQGRQSMSVC